MIGGVFVQATQGTPAGNANMFPANGKPAFAIDGDSVHSKYRNFGEINTGFVVTPSFGGGQGGVGTFVTRLDIATADDAPERDPRLSHLRARMVTH